MIPDTVFASTLRQLLSPLEPYLSDPEVGEIIINGPFSIFVERAGRILPVDARFEHEESLLAALRVIAQYAGRPLDDDHPILEARMPDGSRVEAVLAPLARGGAHVAIRRFRRDTLDLERMIEKGCLDGEAAALLATAVAAKQNILVAGGTGTGKTSLLNVLTEFIPADERLVVVEDATELCPRNQHVVQLESRPADARGKRAVSVRALLKATLRLRPDRIIVGEVRDGAALDLLQALTSGHGGCLATVHANHPRDALMRLETLAMMADVDLPLKAIRAQVVSAIDLVVQLSRLRNGARVVTHIAQVEELDDQGRYVLSSLLTREQDGSALGRLVRTSAKARAEEIHDAQCCREELQNAIS